MWTTFTLVSLCLFYMVLARLFPAVMKPLWWILLLILYRFRVHGRVNVPKEGPALILSNHVTYIDWMILWAASPRRPMFVLWSGYYKNRILRFFLGWVRNNAIPIESRTFQPHQLEESLRRIASALDAGKVVVMFPEGRLTRSANMRPLTRGVEHILRMTKHPIPVIPACTNGLWGSFFSHQGGPIMRKRPRAFRPPVAAMFGKPLVAQPGQNNVTMPVIRQAIQETMADCAIAERGRVLLAHRAFVRRALKFRNLFRLAAIDYSTGTERRLSNAKLFVASMCMADYLRPRVGDSANVGVWMPTSLASALVNLALAYLGRTSVNLNYTAGPDACRSAARQANLSIVITSKRFLTRIPLELPGDIQQIYVEDVLAATTGSQKILTMLMAVFLPGWFVDLFVLKLYRHKPEQRLTIIFSSGSTGEPKGVILTHANVATNAEGMISTVSLAPNDRILASLPFFHSFGFTVCLWVPLMCGAVAVYFPDPRSAKEIGEICRRDRLTIVLSTATFLRFYLRRCGPDDFRALRLLICGAEKLPVKLQDEFEAKFQHRPLEGYGCTELSPVVSTNRPNVVIAGVKQVCNSVGTVGQPILGVCVKAFDPETLTPLPPGVEGVLCAKGPNVMEGYLDQPGLTAAAVFDGWYNTGDMGLIEEDGFIRITGRMSRFAKIAGEMVPLEKLEEELHDAFGGQGDRVLAVAAVPDEKRGERLVVLYLPELDGKMESLLDQLRTRGLPNLWIPDSRDCYKLESLPLLGSGKLDLRRLIDLAKEMSRVG